MGKICVTAFMKHNVSHVIPIVLIIVDNLINVV
jgi:hypothetical protein